MPKSRAATEPTAPLPILIEFDHGLGDAVQLTAVLAHLKHERPHWTIDVASLRGKHTAFTGLCRQSLIIDHDPIDRKAYAQVYRLHWHECHCDKPDEPSTKTTRCLREVFGIEPDPTLCRYSIQTTVEAKVAAYQALSQYCDRPADAKDDFRTVLIHYQGNTSNDRKDLTHELIQELCDIINAAGFTPVILDWDNRSPLPNGTTIHNPGQSHPLWNGHGTGDALALAALIESSTLMIGVDSGPLHVAGATTTPTIAVWTGHHPVHYFDLADNVLHLVPAEHPKLAAGPAAVKYFKTAYKHQVYRRLNIDLPALVQSTLTGEEFADLQNKRMLKALTSTSFDRTYYDEHKLAGLDYLGHGDWQAQYGRWLVESLAWSNKTVLDVGCACGSILRGLGAAGAIVAGVDISEHMINLGRKKWPDMQTIIHTCDAVNLHLFRDQQFHGLHSAQVAEHWKPHLVPHILEELHRVTADNGLFFCALDTTELFARQGRTMETEDPTHVCIRELAWWHEQLTVAGWHLCTAEFKPALTNHPGSFLVNYDWDWFVARKDPAGSATQLQLAAAAPKSTSSQR